MKKTKLGIIGCGAIGSSIARYCKDNLADDVKLEVLFDLDKERAKVLQESILEDVQIAPSLDEVVLLSDLVIEAATAKVVPEVLEKAIKAKKSIMIMSVGGVVGREDLLSLARKNGCKVYFPSGAICGIDGVKAAASRKIDQATLTTRKPPKGLKGAPYIEKNRIDLDSLKEEKIIFEGSASEAVKGFPKNINVSACLSLAGIGVKDTKVRIICSPGSNRNIHEVELKGEFGRLLTRTENVPSPDNPKTSFLAALSAIATLKGVVDSVRIGT